MQNQSESATKSACAGLFFFLIGGAAFIGSQAYSIGNATQMGPGYFPALLGILLAALGFAMMINGLRIGLVRIPIRWQQIEATAMIIASIIAFGLLIDKIGLIGALFISVLIACARRVLKNPLEVFLTFCCLLAFCSLIFIYFFEMPIPLYRVPEFLRL